MLESKPKRSHEYISRAMEDGTVIVSTVSGQLSVVNDVGAIIWDLVDGQHSVADIVLAIIDRFDVSRVQAEADVTAFLQMLEQRQLIVWKGDH